MIGFDKAKDEDKTISITIKIAWWFRVLYMPTVVWMANITGNEIDMVKFEYWLSKAIRVVK